MTWIFISFILDIHFITTLGEISLDGIQHNVFRFKAMPERIQINEPYSHLTFLSRFLHCCGLNSFIHLPDEWLLTVQQSPNYRPFSFLWFFSFVLTWLILLTRKWRMFDNPRGKQLTYLTLESFRSFKSFRSFGSFRSFRSWKSLKSIGIFGTGYQSMLI